MLNQISRLIEMNVLCFLYVNSVYILVVNMEGRSQTPTG